MNQNSKIVHALESLIIFVPELERSVFMEFQDQLSSISSYTSKLLRKRFGRGPRTCQTYANEKHLVVYIRGFISPMEEELLKQGKSEHIEILRNAIIKPVLEELKGIIHVIFQEDVADTYHDWNLPNYSGLLIFVLENPIHTSNEQLSFDIGRFEANIARISQLVQKIPDEINLFFLANQVLLVERRGILIPIEKALIDRGFGEELRMTKDELEKTYFHREGNFVDLFNKRIADIFIDWNFKEDKSLMGLIFNDR